MNRLFYIVGLILVLSLGAIAQPAQGLKVEDLFRLKRVGDPQISPDGKKVAYVVTSYDRETNKRTNQIYLVNINGGEPQLLHDSSGKDSRPRWSPDGKELAFISSRDGASQIWTIEVEGNGNARKLTTIASEAGDLTWSPKGNHLLFTSDIYPECPDEECNKQKLEEAANSKVKAKIAEHLLYRHWNSWKEGKRSHLFVVSTQNNRVRDLTPGDYDTPPFSLGGSDNYTFSPDGKEVCFSRNIDKDEALSTNNDLFIVPTQGGDPKRISTSLGSDVNPVYSPDGRYIAYRSQERAGFESDRFRLMLYDRQTGKTESMLDAVDTSVDEMVWSPDSTHIYFTAVEAGYIPIFSFNLNNRRVKKLADKTANGELAISDDGSTLICTRSSMTEPSEVYTINIQTLAARRLTETNANLLSKRKLIEGEDVYSKGANGASVHSLLIKPVNFDANKKYPMIVLIHGGPQGAWEHNFSYRWNANIYASAGYVVLMPNPRGSTGYGQKFVDEISGDWGGKCFDDIMGAVDNAISLGFVDKNRIGAAGGSFGGYMVDWILGHTNRFKALVSHAGVYNLVSMYGVTEELWFTDWEFKGTPWTNRALYDKFSPSNFVENFKTPTLVIHGELDYRVPVGEGLQLFTALQRQKVPSKLLVFPDEGHWVLKPQNSELWYHTVLDWFDKHVR